MTTSISEIVIYPIKSLAGISVDSTIVEPQGLQHDRRWALVSAEGTVLTAREYPQMLALQTALTAEGVSVSNPSAQSITIPFETNSQADEVLKIFSSEACGFEVDKNLSPFFGDYLGVSCRLMRISGRSPRAVAERHGGKPGDQVAFADDCPLLLASTESLLSLNDELTEPMTMRQFRPNIVLSGAAAWSESYWESVSINGSKFEVTQQCKRCDLATTDPETCQQHPRQEPLRTLARTRPRFRGGVAFGIHLAPRGLTAQHTGKLQIGDVAITKIG